jgi:hypothetical protein
MKMIINKLITLADKLDHLNLKKDADKLDRLIIKAVNGEDFGDLMKLFDEPVTLDDKQDDEGSPIVTRTTHIPEEFESLSPTDSDEPEKDGPSRLDMLKRRQKLLKLKKQVELAEKMEKAEELEADEEDLELPIASPEDLEVFEDENDADDDGDDIEEKIRRVERQEIRDLLELVECETCGVDVKPGRMHHPNHDPDAGPPHRPEGKADLWPELSTSRSRREHEGEGEFWSNADDGELLETLKEKLKSVPELAKQLLTLIKENPELLALLAL